MRDRHDQIRAFIGKILRDDELDLELDEPLFSSGLLDSFSVHQLVRYVEESFEVKIPSDARLTDFDTVRKIDGLVKRLRARMMS